MSTETTKTTKVEIRYIPDAKLGDALVKATLGDPEGYLPAADLDLVDQPGFRYSRREPNHPRSLETIYRQYQQIDGAPEERVVQLRRRSMTTGDAIVFNGVAYYVAATGFVTKEADGTLKPVEAPEA